MACEKLRGIDGRGVRTTTQRLLDQIKLAKQGKPLEWEDQKVTDHIMEWKKVRDERIDMIRVYRPDVTIVDIIENCKRIWLQSPSFISFDDTVARNAELAKQGKPLEWEEGSPTVSEISDGFSKLSEAGRTIGEHTHSGLEPPDAHLNETCDTMAVSVSIEGILKHRPDLSRSDLIDQCSKLKLEGVGLGRFLTFLREERDRARKGEPLSWEDPPESKLITVTVEKDRFSSHVVVTVTGWRDELPKGCNFFDYPDPFCGGISIWTSCEHIWNRWLAGIDTNGGMHSFPDDCKSYDGLEMDEIARVVERRIRFIEDVIEKTVAYDKYEHTFTL